MASASNTRSGRHPVAPPTSMYSMKRTSPRWSEANSKRSTSSSSLNPRITTVSSFSGRSPAAFAAVIPSRTASSPSRRVSERNRSGRKVSRLTVIRCRPASLSAAGLTGEEDPVGGQGDVLDPRDDRNQPDQFGQVAADQRLPAGDPELPHPERREPLDDERRLVETQEVLPRQPHILLLRHAVLATEVAAVGDREAQAAERPAEPVTNGSGEQRQGRYSLLLRPLERPGSFHSTASSSTSKSRVAYGGIRGCRPAAP